MNRNGELDLENYRLQPSIAESIVKERGRSIHLPRHKKGERFLKGPIPWSWLMKAMSLGGSALAVGIAIWRLAGVKSDPTVLLVPSETQAIGDRKTVYRGLGKLESAGLVRCSRHRGRSPTVTLLASSPFGLGDERDSTGKTENEVDL
jgi:hypothetical protein